MSNECALRVLHLASGDLWAGAEVQLFTLAKGLHTKSSARVSVVLFNNGRLQRELLAAGIEVTVLDESALNSPELLYRLVRIFREQNPDIIHTHRIKENVLGGIAALFAGVPSVRTVHGAPEHQPAGLAFVKRLRYFIDRFCGRFLQKKIIAVSNDLAGILAKQYPPGMIRIIPNAIDPDDFEPLEKPESRHATAGHNFTIGFIGRLVSVKRPELFIEAAYFLRLSHPEMNAGFHIYGDGPLRSKLDGLCRELQTDDIVHFEGHCNDIVRVLPHLDALLMTSEHEGLPMVLLEAMASGTPVIAHATGGIPEVLGNGSCGLLVNEHTGQGYASVLHTLLADPGLRTDITSKALQRVRNNYSIEQHVRSYCSLYMDIR